MPDRNWLGILDVPRRTDAVPLLDPVRALREFFAAFAPHVGAESGLFVLSARIVADRADPLRGWRPVHNERFGRDHAWHTTIVDEWVGDTEANVVSDETTQRIVAGPYVPRAYLRRELVDDPERDESPSGRLMRQLGVSDRLVVGTPVTARSELFVGFDRRDGQPPFEPADKDVALAVAPLFARHGRSLALRYGLIGPEGMLTERERAVLGQLLGGASEKEAADAIGMSTRNCHQRVVRIYRQLGVASRAELLSLWLGGAGTFGTPELWPDVTGSAVPSAPQ